MPKTKRKPTEKWEHPQLKRCYCYNRNGIVYFSINTKRIASNPTIKFTASNKSVALELLNAYLNASKQGLSTNKERSLFDLLEEYKRTHFATLSPKTQHSKKWVITKYITKNYNLDNLQEFKADLIEQLNQSAINSNTKNKVINIIKAILNYGISLGYLSDNILNNTKFRKEPTREIKLTLANLDLIINNCEYEDTRLLLLFLRYSGCRIMEALQLTSADLLIDRIRIKGKGNYLRYINNDFIDEYNIIFPNNEIKWGSREQTHRTRVYNIAQRLNIEWQGFHDIRKLRETELIDKYNLPDNIVSEIIGHTLVVQANTYRQKRNESDKEAIAKKYKQKSAE